MEIVLLERDDASVISLKGHLTEKNVEKLKKMLDGLLESEKHKVVLNFEDTAYLDSSGLAVIVSRTREFRKNKGDLRLAGMNDKVKEIFDVTFLSQLYRIYDNSEEACKNF